MSSSIILVAGATGGTGQRVVEQLLQQGRRVRILVRDAAKAQALFGDALECHIAMVQDASAVAKAVYGVDYLVSAIGARTRANDPLNTGETVDYIGNLNLVNAAKQYSVKQYVLVSTGGLAASVFEASLQQRPILEWKLKAEQVVQNSGVPYTIVRPGRLLNDEGGHLGTRSSQGDYQRGPITRDDVARVCVAALQNSVAQCKTLEVVNDESTQPVQDWNAFFSALHDH